MTNVVVPLQHDNHWTDRLTLTSHDCPLGQGADDEVAALV
jgi:hypothetical protein